MAITHKGPVGTWTDPLPTGGYSPWGAVDHIDQLGDGVWLVGTPSHGGVYVNGEARRRIPSVVTETLYTAAVGDSAWFEEDAEAALALTLLWDHCDPERLADVGFGDRAAMSKHALGTCLGLRRYEPGLAAIREAAQCVTEPEFDALAAAAQKQRDELAALGIHL